MNRKAAAGSARLVAVAIVYALGAAAAYGLKAFYSGANADALRWVLAPTCWLVGRLAGVELIDEAGAGFISHAHHIVVGPACSGVNFLVICFAALFFSLAHRLGSPGRRLGWLLASLAIAYAATILTNTLRVVLAIQLYRLDIYGSALTPARLHRLMGTVLYGLSLVGVHRLAERWLRRSAGRQSRWVPFAWYLGIVVIVPLCRRLASHGLDARFFEHAAMVTAASLSLVALGRVAKVLSDRLQSKQPREVSPS